MIAAGHSYPIACENQALQCSGSLWRLGRSAIVAPRSTCYRERVLSCTADKGRPTSLALVGKLYGEAELLSVAEAWQNATRWHLARPELTR